MVLSSDKKIEHFRGGGGGGSRGGGGFSRGGGGYGLGGVGNYARNGSGYGRLEGSRNPNIRYGGYNNYSGGNNNGYNYGWNNYPLYYNNYIPVDPNENDEVDNTITENFMNNFDNIDNNQISVIWYIISLFLILFILMRK